MIIPADFAQVNLRFTGDPIPTGAECTFGCDVALYPGDPAALGLLIRGHLLTSNIAQNYVNNVTLSSILVKFGPNQTGPAAVTAAALTGTKAGDVSPGAVGALVNKNTAFGGRAGKGRMYWPGMSQDDVDDANRLSAGFTTAMTTALELFRTKMETDDVGIVLLHGAGSPLTIPTPVTSFSTQALLATQRRRMRR